MSKHRTISLSIREARAVCDVLDKGLPEGQPQRDKIAKVWFRLRQETKKTKNK